MRLELVLANARAVSGKGQMLHANLELAWFGKCSASEPEAVRVRKYRCGRQSRPEASPRRSPQRPSPPDPAQQQRQPICPDRLRTAEELPRQAQDGQAKAKAKETPVVVLSSGVLLVVYVPCLSAAGAPPPAGRSVASSHVAATQQLPVRRARDITIMIQLIALQW